MTWKNTPTVTDMTKGDKMYPVYDKRSWDRVPSSIRNTHNFVAVHFLGVDGGENYNLYGEGYGGHATIFLNGDIYLRCYNEATIWAVGASSGFKQKHPVARNMNTFSIEMCCYNTNHASSSSDPTWYFTQATQEACVQLVRSKFEEFGWPLTKESIDEHLLRHGDITTKNCPAPYITCEGYKGPKGQNWYWSEFKEAVRTGICPDPNKTNPQWYRIRKSWEDAKSQLGAYLDLERAKQACPKGYNVYDAEGKLVYANPLKKGLQATTLKPMSEAEVVEFMGKYFTADQQKSGILASVSMAQFILESGYGHTELAQNANNCFGMKASLSGNTWSGSTWDGKSIYTKETKEQNPDGSIVVIKADFREYENIEDSIADHSAYLLGAKKGDALRYEGLKGEKNYRKAIQIIKDGGYATDLNYVDKLCNIIERWALTDFDYEDEFEPYMVRVVVTNLNIRKGPGTNYSKWGKFTGKGVFTIVDEADGDGAVKWGLLKAYSKDRNGWIALNPDWVKVI